MCFFFEPEKKLLRINDNKFRYKEIISINRNFKRIA